MLRFEKALEIEENKEVREELQSLHDTFNKMKEKGIRSCMEHFRAKQHIEDRTQEMSTVDFSSS